jgi:hypothetical protein
VFAELRNPYDVDELAQAFIPDRGSDPTWTGFARTLFSAVTRQAQTAGIRDVGELYRLLVIAPKEELQLLVAGTPAAPFLTEGSDKLFQGARSTVTAAVKSLDFVRAQQSALFSVREWVKSGKRRAVPAVPGRPDLGAQGDHLDLDALGDLPDHESGGGGSSVVVRGGRARRAWAH